MNDKTGKPVDVVIGALVRPGPDRLELLITRRLDTQVLPGFWELPGGKIEHDESPADALAREFREELGIQIDVEQHLCSVEHDYAHGTVRLHAFTCSLKSGTPVNRQVAEHRWIGPAELATYRFPPANAAITRQLIAHFDPDQSATKPG